MLTSDRILADPKTRERALQWLACMLDNAWLRVDCRQGNEWALEELDELRWLGVSQDTRIDL